MSTAPGTPFRYRIPEEELSNPSPSNQEIAAAVAAAEQSTGSDESERARLCGIAAALKRKSTIALLKSKMQPGDELWEFCSPQEDWHRLMGRAGFEIVRNGEVVFQQVDFMN